MNSFTTFQAVAFGMIAVAGTAVVLTRNPRRQIFVAGIFGLFQAILFYMLHSPDVALSEIAVGTIAMPALVLATLAKLERSK